MGELNIYRKMGEIRKLISIWSSRNLTPYGKVSIIKSLLMSKITHMLLSLSSPDVICIKELYNTFSNFLWCGKPPKWRKEILKGEIHHRGLKPGSHRQDMAQDTARTCHDQEFRSENSFNS